MISLYLTGVESSNILEPIADQLYKNQLTCDEKLERKCLFIEGAIRFLNIYCANEIGSGEVSIPKLCIWVNSAYFENVELRRFETIENVYEYMENMILNNIPLYRLFNISKTVQNILEKDHIAELQKEMLKDAETTPCLKCIWYEYEKTSIGVRSVCNFVQEGLPVRKSFLDISKVAECKNCITINDDDAIKRARNKFSTLRGKRKFDESVKYSKKCWLEKFNSLDNSTIPVEFESIDIEQLREKSKDIMYDLARAISNKLTYSEMYDNLKLGVVVDCIIRFVEIYAKSEFGNDFVADIKSICKYVYSNNFVKELDITTEDDVYKYIENMIIDGFDIIQFCKHEE